MTPTTPQLVTAKNVIAFALIAFAMSVGVWREARGLTTSTEVMFLSGVGLLGVWLVASKLVEAYLNKVREVAPGLLAARRGEPLHDAVQVTTPRDKDTIVRREDAEPVLVPSAGPPRALVPVDRLAYDTADSIRLTARPEPARETPTLRMTIPDAPAPVRRRRRATDPAPVLVPPTEVQPQSESPLDGVNREDG